MATAILPIVATVAGIIEPYLPTIIQGVENLFGHSSVTGSKDGTAKMQAAVAVGSALLTGLAEAGKIPATGVVDATLPTVLAAAVQKAVDAMKAAGLLTAPLAAPSAVKPSATLAPVALPTGKVTTAFPPGLADFMIYVGGVMKGA
jgi:hypothetical protein